MRRHYTVEDVLRFYKDGEVSSELKKNQRNGFMKYTKNFQLTEDGKQLLYVDKENDQPESEKRRIVVFTEQEKQIIFNDVHASSRGAHYGVNVTVRKITDRFYWLGVKADVQRWIKSCDACQRSEKLKTVAPELKSIKVEGAWKMLGIDLIGPLQVTSSGNNYILTITDYWTKFVQAFPIPAKSADHVEFHIDQYQVTEEMMAERVNVMSAIKTKVDQNISKAQARQKKYYQQKKSKGYKCFDFRVGMSVLSRNNRKVGRKGHRMENDWLGPYVICKLSNGCVELTNNGQPLKSKVSISNIKPYLIDSKEKSVNVIDNTVTMDSPSKRITLNGANNDDTKVQSNRKLLVIKKDLSKEHETGEPKNVGSVRTKVKRKLLLIKQNAAFVSSLNNGKCEATGRVNTATEVRTVSSDSVPKMVSILNKTLISDGSTKPQIKDGLDIKPSAGKQAIPVRMDCKETGVGYEDDACTTSVDELVGDPDSVIVENENLACEPRVSRRKKGKESGRGSDVKDLVQASTISGDFYKRLPLAGKRRIFKILDSPTDWLDDNVIDAAQSLLSVQFNSLAGFQAACSLCEPKFGGYMPSDSSSFVQIVNVNRNHWSVVSNLSSEAGSQGKVVQYYDSLLVGANKRCVPFSVCQVAASTLFCQSSEKITVDVMDCQKQSGGNDCGLFAVAHATALCFGMDPSLFQWKQDQMRSHLKKCISSGRIEMFPHTYQNVHKKVILFSFDFDIYCHCRKPYDKKCSGKGVVACDKCNQWYHQSWNSHLSSPEPMSPGSPVQTGSNNLNTTCPSYLPGFLLGDSTPTVPMSSPHLWSQQNSSMSKNKSNLSNINSHNDSSKRRVTFSPLPPSTVRIGNRSAADKHEGPPVQGLFDHSSNPTAVSDRSRNLSEMNQSASNSLQRSVLQETSILSPMRRTDIIIPQDTRDILYSSIDNDESTWVTIYGFPPSAASFLLQQFSQYGTISKHKMPDKGNWMHVCYKSKLQAKKAISKNGKIIGGNMMVGVKLCVDVAFEKENSMNMSNISALRDSGMDQSRVQSFNKSSSIRPLTQAYKVSASEREVDMSHKVPKKNSSAIESLMDYVFGW
ncbi:Nucleoporin NUP35 [Nymphon striatum]|nr:Nucleoporin NUP35 [Nymphon striatum]